MHDEMHSIAGIGIPYESKLDHLPTLLKWHGARPFCQRSMGNTL